MFPSVEARNLRKRFSLEKPNGVDLGLAYYLVIYYIQVKVISLFYYRQMTRKVTEIRRELPLWWKKETSPKEQIKESGNKNTKLYFSTIPQDTLIQHTHEYD